MTTEIPADLVDALATIAWWGRSSDDIDDDFFAAVALIDAWLTQLGRLPPQSPEGLSTAAEWAAFNEARAEWEARHHA
jgi:hypothetical protein